MRRDSNPTVMLGYVLTFTVLVGVVLALAILWKVVIP